MTPIDAVREAKRASDRDITKQDLVFAHEQFITGPASTVGLYLRPV